MKLVMRIRPTPLASLAAPKKQLHGQAGLPGCCGSSTIRVQGLIVHHHRHTHTATQTPWTCSSSPKMHTRRANVGVSFIYIFITGGATAYSHRNSNARGKGQRPSFPYTNYFTSDVTNCKKTRMDFFMREKPNLTVTFP